MPRPNNVGVGVAIGVVCDPNEILLLKRMGAHAAGTWACPGGWVDFEDESPEDTCIRELKEELGVEVLDRSELKLLTAVSENHKDLGIKSVTLYYVIGSHYLLGEPKIMERNKASELEWFDLDELPSPLFPKLAEVLSIR